MIGPSENRIEHFGTVIISVLFLFFLALFHQNSKNQDISGAFRNQISNHLSYVIQLKDIPQLVSLESFISKFEEMKHEHFSKLLKLQADNRLINQRFLSTQRVELLIKPPYPDFFHHHQSVNTEDIPILS